MTWFNCRFHDNGQEGVVSSAGSWLYFKCEFDNNGTVGTLVRQETFIDCSFHHNGSHGIECNTTGPVLIHCRVYRNAGAGIDLNTRHAAPILWHTDVYDNDGGGIISGSTFTTSNSIVSPNAILNSIIAGNGGYGVQFNVSDPQATKFPEFIDYNLFSANVSGHRNGGCPTDFSGNSPADDTDPEFTSTTEDAENFKPADGSPLIGAAMPKGTA
jgi:hypothetical protein